MHVRLNLNFFSDILSSQRVPEVQQEVERWEANVAENCAEKWAELRQELQRVRHEVDAADAEVDACGVGMKRKK